MLNIARLVLHSSSNNAQVQLLNLESKYAVLSRFNINLNK